MKYLKVLLLCLLSSLFIGALAWAETTSTDRMSLVKTTKLNVDKKTYSTIKLTFPVIKNVAHSEVLNAEIERLVNEIVLHFQQSLKENGQSTPIPNLPLTTNSNALEVNYEVFAATPTLISLRFSIYTFFYGAAHPLTVYRSLNFDTQTGRLLALKDIFKHDDYLSFLSNHAKKALTEKLSKEGAGADVPYPEGIKPTNENFSVWNTTPKGLLFTFQPYQVAAYVFGPQEVLIPYAEVNSLLRTTYR